jgi:hypothetical protein
MPKDKIEAILRDQLYVKFLSWYQLYNLETIWRDQLPVKFLS